jgi:nucleoid-associated protein YgaU
VYRRRRIAALAVVVVGLLLLFLGARLAGSWALGVLGGGPLTASEAGLSAAATVQSPVAGSSPSPAQVHLRVEPVSQATYIVAPGDTLWSIARRLQPTGDVRPLVYALAASRHGRPLQAGEPIVMPALPGS